LQQHGFNHGKKASNCNKHLNVMRLNNIRRLTDLNSADQDIKIKAITVLFKAPKAILYDGVFVFYLRSQIKS
jgi:hypothetical protein